MSGASDLSVYVSGREDPPVTSSQATQTEVCSHKHFKTKAKDLEKRLFASAKGYTFKLSTMLATAEREVDSLRINCFTKDEQQQQLVTDSKRAEAEISDLSSQLSEAARHKIELEAANKTLQNHLSSVESMPPALDAVPPLPLLHRHTYNPATHAGQQQSNP